LKMPEIEGQDEKIGEVKNVIVNEKKNGSARKTVLVDSPLLGRHSTSNTAHAGEKGGKSFGRRTNQGDGP